MRRILNPIASQKLFALLTSGDEHFKARLLAGALANLGRFNDRADGELYLNIGHTGLNSSGFREWLGRTNVRPIYLVHDLIPVTHPQYCRPGESERHRERMRTVLTTGAGVIGNSQATLNELDLFARSEGLSVPPSLAAWLGTDPLPLPTRAEDTTPPSFLVVGTIEGRKNHILLLRIWSRLVAQLGDAAPRLLIVGQRGWEADQVFDVLDHDRKLQSHVVELNACSDAKLAEHLASARALLFPSFSEGFGLPLIEALAGGVPVIASDLPAFRELCGDVPTYLAPDDEEGWLSTIRDFATTGSTARAAQMERMQGYAPPTWAAHFSSVEAWLRNLP